MCAGGGSEDEERLVVGKRGVLGGEEALKVLLGGCVGRGGSVVVPFRLGRSLHAVPAGHSAGLFVISAPAPVAVTKRCGPGGGAASVGKRE